MPIRRRTARRGTSAIPPYVIRALLSGHFKRVAPEDNALELLLLREDRHRQEELWSAIRDRELVRWIRQKPGTRPWCWWAHDAPKWQLEDMPARLQQHGSLYVGQFAEPRRRLGGVGTPSYEALAALPAFDRGIPMYWVSTFLVEYFNGRRRNIHGNRIGTEYAEGHFPYEAIDPFNPPVFESEASYLERHELLTVSERRALGPAAFDPIRISED